MSEIIFYDIPLFFATKKTVVCLTVRVSLMLELYTGNGFYATYALEKVSKIIQNGLLVVSGDHFYQNSPKFLLSTLWNYKDNLHFCVIFGIYKQTNVFNWSDQLSENRHILSAGDQLSESPVK